MGAAAWKSCDNFLEGECVVEMEVVGVGMYDGTKDMRGVEKRTRGGGGAGEEGQRGATRDIRLVGCEVW